MRNKHIELLKKNCISVQRNPLHRSLYVKGFGAAAVQNMAAKKNFAKK
jgi:hypothetical protein